MHPNLIIPLRAALAMMLVRLVYFYSAIYWEPFDLAYLFLVLAGFPALAIYALWPRKATLSFISDVNQSMRVTATYGLLMLGFVVLYFSQIDVNYFADRQEQILQNELAANPGLDREELTAKVKSFFSIRNFAVIALVALVVMSAFYSVLFAAVKRLMPASTR